MLRKATLSIACLATALAAGTLASTPASAAGLPGITIAEEQPPAKAGFTLASGKVTIETKEVKLTCESSEGSATLATSTFADPEMIDCLRGASDSGSAERQW